MLKMQALFVISFLWLSRLPLFPLKFCVVLVGSQHASLSMMMLRKIQETSLQSTIVQHAEPETRGKVCYFWFSGVGGNLIVSLSVHLSLQIGSFDFERAQMCNEGAKEIVEHQRNEAKRKEAKRAQEYQVGRTRECIEEIHAVL